LPPMSADGQSFSSFDDSYYSSILSTIMAAPYEAQLTEDVDYVVHLSSMPLATMVDVGFVHRLLDKDHKSNNHLTHAQGGCASPRCIARGTKSGIRYPEGIREHCTCLKIAPEATHVCFLEALTSVDDMVGTRNPRINLKRTMFCPNQQSIFSGSYDGPTRTACGLSSYENASTLEDLATILDLTYWSRSERLGDDFIKFAKKFPLVTIPTWRRRLKQILFTIDAVIIQLMLVCPYQLSYTDIAEATRRMFQTLRKEYSVDPVYRDGVPVPNPNGTFYEDLVNFTKYCKWSIQFDDDVWTGFPAQSDCFKKTVMYFLNKYRTHLRGEALMGRDDPTSLRSVLKKLILSQKRGYGHLPRAVAMVKRHKFREAISRPPLVWTREKQAQVMKALLLEFTEELPAAHHIFARDDKKSKEILKEVLSHVSLELKGTASVDRKVSDGGKLEDARELLQLARTNEWFVPIRSLESGKLIGHKTCPSDVDMEEVSTFLFWLSVQLCVNYIHLAKIDKAKPQMWEYVPFIIKETGAPFMYDPFRARVLHIAEAAKERNLVKCSAVYNWAMIVGGKIIQNTMALSPSHRNGLQGSSADWSHFRRVQGTAEGSFLYDRSTGLLRPGTAVNFYSDLTESTDWLVKSLGLVILKIFEIHTRFFPWYMDLLRILYVTPITISETVVIEDEDERIVAHTEYLMTEGTPMGMQLAKSLLHGAHFACMGLVRLALRANSTSLRLTGNTK